MQLKLEYRMKNIIKVIPVPGRYGISDLKVGVLNLV